MTCTPLSLFIYFFKQKNERNRTKNNECEIISCTRNRSLELSARARLRPIRERPVGPSGVSRHAVRAAAIRQQLNRSEKMAVSMAKLLPAQRCLLLVSALFQCSALGQTASEEPPHRRFEYKSSFKGPHLTQSDGMIPFWVHTGSKFSSLFLLL